MQTFYWQLQDQLDYMRGGTAQLSLLHQAMLGEVVVTDLSFDQLDVGRQILHLGATRKKLFGEFDKGPCSWQIGF